MPVEVFQDSMELYVPVLEAHEPGRGYPYPMLLDSGHVAQRVFPTIALENQYLKIQVIPDLGGRVLSVFDKRFGKECLPLPGQLKVVQSFVQGVELPYGLEFSWNAESRGGSMDPIAFQVDETSGAVLLSEIGGTGRSWHLRVSLAEDAALIHFEAMILNRTFVSTPYDSGLLARMDGGQDAFGRTLTVGRSENRSRGLNPQGRRFDSPGNLNPRQVDEWSATIMPVGNLGFGAVAGHGIALEVANGNVRLETAEPKHVEVVLGLGDQTVEAAVQLYPEQTKELPYGENLPVGAVILEDGSELLRWPVEKNQLLGGPALPFASNVDLDSGTLDPAIRHLVHARRAIVAFGKGDPHLADTELERALLFNAEDHLLWWAKAVAQRQLGETDGPELENAHFLAPLEPVLRAEAFLRQPHSDAEIPSPLLAPLATHPEELVEIGALYVEHGLYQDASRFLGEAIRHIDLRMLRYLLAFCLLEGARMDTEAAVQVAAGSRADASVRPWRDIERRVLERLVQRFPDLELRETLTFWEDRIRA